MLQNGADPDIRNAEGKTPLDVASPTAKQIFELHNKGQEQKERRAIHDRAANEASHKPNKTDEYHQHFADQIVEQIRQGNAPWQKPWKPGEESLPKNLSSGKEYRGGNSVYLAVAQGAKGYSDNRWGTYKQIEAAGGHVRKGEKGTRILSFQDHKQNLRHRQSGEARTRCGREQSLPLRETKPSDGAAIHGVQYRSSRTD